jgi:hypothetical protein
MSEDSNTVSIATIDSLGESSPLDSAGSSSSQQGLQLRSLAKLDNSSGGRIGNANSGPVPASISSNNNKVVISAILVACWVVPICLILIFVHSHADMGDTVLVLIGCFAIVSFLLWLATAFSSTSNKNIWEKMADYMQSSGKKHEFDENVSLNTQDDWDRMMGDFKAKIRDSASSMKLLTMFRKKLTKNDKFALESARNGLLKYCTLCLSAADVEDPRIPVCLDVINSLLASPSSKAYLLTDPENVSGAHENIDMFLDAANILYGKYVDACKESDGADAEDFDETGQLTISTSRGRQFV